MCNENGEWWKIGRRIGLSFQNWHKEFDEFWLESLKSLNNLHFNGLLLTKVYNVWAKNDKVCGLENDKRNLADFHQCTRKHQNWDFHWAL